MVGPVNQLIQLIPELVLAFGLASGLSISMLGFWLVKRIIEDEFDDPDAVNFRRAFDDREDDEYPEHYGEYGEEQDDVSDVEEWTDFDDYQNEWAPEMVFQDDYPDEWEEHENW